MNFISRSQTRAPRARRARGGLGALAALAALLIALATPAATSLGATPPAPARLGPAPAITPAVTAAAFADSTPSPSLAGDPDSGGELLGRPAPEFRFSRWLRTAPLTPEGLRGKVVLLRFWTDHCRFCEHTLPAIESLRQRYGAQGLVVLGAYHPNEPKAVTDSFVLRWAKKLGFGGPIAVDDRWATLERWWLDGHPERSWVSVSFLIDRDGNVCWVHGGGEYHPSKDLEHRRCDRKFAELERVIRERLGS